MGGLYYSCGRSIQRAEVCATLIAPCRSTQGYTTDYDAALLRAALALYSSAGSPRSVPAKTDSNLGGGGGGGVGGGGGLDGAEEGSVSAPDVPMNAAGHRAQSTQIPAALTWALIFLDCLLSATQPHPRRPQEHVRVHIPAETEGVVVPSVNKLAGYVVPSPGELSVKQCFPL